MSRLDVVLVDAGGSNLGSVRHALERLGIQSETTHNRKLIERASHVILPGVGTAANGMHQLRNAGLVEVMQNLQQPVLGICLGMQLLFDFSEEGETPCLGIIPGRVRRMDAGSALRVPHMGWNTLLQRRADPLLAGLAPDASAYFVHGFAVDCCEATIASVEYGQEWTAMVRDRNFCGMQFHPERSAGAGARLLKNFLDA